MPHTPSAAGTDLAAFWPRFPQNESLTKSAVGLPEFCVVEDALVCPEDVRLAPPKSRALTTCGWLKNDLAAFSPPLNQRLCCATRDAAVWPSDGASRNLKHDGFGSGQALSLGPTSARAVGSSKVPRFGSPNKASLGGRCLIRLPTRFLRIDLLTVRSAAMSKGRMRQIPQKERFAITVDEADENHQCTHERNASDEEDDAAERGGRCIRVVRLTPMLSWPVIVHPCSPRKVAMAPSSGAMAECVMAYSRKQLSLSKDSIEDGAKWNLAVNKDS